MPHLICVGAVYMDTILSVPHYPEEDTKLRATNVTRRRGGNTANTLEVISQLLAQNRDNAPPASTRLSLLTILPDPDSEDTKSIVQSLPHVNPHLYLYRHGHPVAASSYITQSAQTLSRTIVSASPLADMTVAEFQAGVAPLVAATAVADDVWIHFEGRDAAVVEGCVAWVRATYGYGGTVRVSVECEKAGRTGLRRAAAMADVVFYSRVWAEAHADSPSAFLTAQIPATLPHALLLCTCGSGGAVALRKTPAARAVVATQRGWRAPAGSQPVDSVGAGDTFIAGVLYGMVVQGAWTTEERLGFANELAGRKVYQEGFAGLGEQMRGSEVWGEKMRRGCTAG